MLTSDVSGNVKQSHLFLAKTIETRSNFSRASRSFAPPGHSCHCVADFDIGKTGYGERDLASAFSSTGEQKRVAALKYV